MPGPIVPETFGLLLTAFQGCFHAPSYANFQWLVPGWIQCPGRRTITEVALAAGAVGARHISVFQRFYARAQRSLDAVRQVVMQLALRWLPANQPLYLLADQDRGRWDRSLITEGQPLVRRCLRLNRPGPYQIQAAIDAVHSDAPTAAATDWWQIVTLYDQLLSLTPSPVVALNRAVAVAKVEGPEAALAYESAIARAENAAERAFLQRRGQALTRTC